MFKLLATLFSALFFAASVSQAAPRMSIIVTCEGEPPTVIASQSSATAPIISIGADYAQAISDVVSTLLADVNATWQVIPSTPDKGITAYSIVETVKGFAGPPGPEGPQGPAGVIDLNKLAVFQSLDAGNTSSVLCPVDSKVVGGGGACNGGVLGSSLPLNRGWLVTCVRADPSVPVAQTNATAIYLNP